MDWCDHITVNSEVHHGKPCIKGTQVMVSVILDNLAAGQAVEEIITSYPPLNPDDVQATIAYAADLARERIVDMPA